MKPILALLLIGVACATASPTCSEEGFSSCFGHDPRADDDSFRETEEYLDNTCEQFSCALDYKKKCGYPDNLPFTIASFKQYQKIYDAVCEKHTTMRQNYLENVSCLNRQTKSLSDKCEIRRGLEQQDPDFCPSVVNFMLCTYDVIRYECGRVAAEVYSAVAPDEEFYGC